MQALEAKITNNKSSSEEKKEWHLTTFAVWLDKISSTINNIARRKPGKSGN